MSIKHVNNLQLSWERNEESQLQQNVEEILEVLQPQTQQLHSLGLLVDCQSCLHLPNCGKLPSLKKLVVSKTSHVKYICEESSNGGVAGGFTKLEILVLEILPNLVRISREDRDNTFPCLSTLQITECPIMLGLPCLSSIRKLIVRGKCNQHLLSSVHKLSSLESIKLIDNNKDIRCFPDGMLRNMTSLKIFDFYGFSKLEQLPTNLNAILEMYISCCDNLKSLTDEVFQGLHSLKMLSIRKCQKFNLSESFQYLTCLEKLMIQTCSEIEDLHDVLQHLTTLKSLTLCDLPNLTSLPDWLGNLGLLHSLGISACPKLMCLSMSIQCLTGLKSLEIYGCSELEERCKVTTGDDWPKIAHIQRIEVRSCPIYTGGRRCALTVDLL